MYCERVSFLQISWKLFEESLCLLLPETAKLTIHYPLLVLMYLYEVNEQEYLESNYAGVILWYS